MDFKVEEKCCERAHRNIYGKLYIPQDVSGRAPAVIFSHGYGATWETGVPYAKALAAKGYYVYCFDFCGGGDYSKSEGSPRDMSVLTEKKDLEAAFAMVREIPGVDPGFIYLMGASQGGLVSAMVCSEHAEEVRGMILLYPAFCLQDIVHKLFHDVSGIPEQYAYLPILNVGAAYAKDVWDYDVYAHMDYRNRVLILHGSGDTIVDISYSKKALERYPNAKLKVIEGADHGFRGREVEKAMAYIYEYLDKDRAEESSILS